MVHVSFHGLFPSCHTIGEGFGTLPSPPEAHKPLSNPSPQTLNPEPVLLASRLSLLSDGAVRLHPHLAPVACVLEAMLKVRGREVSIKVRSLFKADASSNVAFRSMTCVPYMEIDMYVYMYIYICIYSTCLQGT